jgi:hypothetical protein
MSISNLLSQGNKPWANLYINDLTVATNSSFKNIEVSGTINGHTGFVPDPLTVNDLTVTDNASFNNIEVTGTVNGHTGFVPDPLTISNIISGTINNSAAVITENLAVLDYAVFQDNVFINNALHYNSFFQSGIFTYINSNTFNATAANILGGVILNKNISSDSTIYLPSATDIYSIIPNIPVFSFFIIYLVNEQQHLMSLANSIDNTFICYSSNIGVIATSTTSNVRPVFCRVVQLFPTINIYAY